MPLQLSILLPAQLICCSRIFVEQNKENEMEQNTQPVLDDRTVKSVMSEWFQAHHEHLKQFEAALPDTTGWEYSDYLAEFRRTTTEIRAAYTGQPIDQDRVSRAMHAFHVLQAISHRAGYRATMTMGDTESTVANTAMIITFEYNAVLGDADVQG